MTPKNKNVLILLVAGFVLALAAGFLLNGSNPTPATSPVSLRPKESQTPEVVQAIIRQALDTRTQAVCAEISDAEKRAYCNDNVLIVVASDKNDPTICTKILDKNTSAVCSDNFLITRALNSRDAGACNALTDKNRVPQCKTDVQAFMDNQTRN